MSEFDDWFNKTVNKKNTTEKNTAGNNGINETDANKAGMDDSKKKKIIYGICGFIAVLIIILIILLARGCSNASAKKNMVNLAKTYATKGEYDRALNKLDAYLEKHGDDDDIWDLWNQIVDMKKAAENGQTPAGFGVGNVNVDVDTSSISDAMQDSIATMKDALEQSNKQAEENRKAMENMLKLQQDQKEQEEKRKADEAVAQEAKKQAEAEKAAEEAAAAEQKRLADEKRKAEEEALAKKNAELKKQIDAVNAEIQKGKTALAMGNTDEAMKYFSNANSIMPGSAGEAFAGTKDSEIAQALYEAAEKAGDSETKNNLMIQAVNMAQQAVDKNPKDAGAHYIIAQNAINNKDYNKALQEMKAAVEYDPNNYLYWYNLGKIQYTLKKYTEAASSFSKSCELKDDFAPSRYNLGLTYKQLKNETNALAAFRKTIDIDPRHEKAYLEEARILAARGDYSGAIDCYKSVLKINNINVQAAMELGNVYYQRKNYADAEDSYRRALTMLSDGSQMTLTKFNLSTVLFDAGKVGDAEKYAREAYESKSYLKSSNDQANIVYNYALILDKTGNVDKAIPCYMEVLDLNPDHIKTKINLGVMYMNLNPPDVEMALNLLLQAYNKDNKNFEANNNLGSAYLMNEDYKNAVRFYQNALKLDSSNNAVRANLAKAYAKNGDYNNAQTTYRELLKSDVNNLDAYIELAKVCMQLNDNQAAEGYLVTAQSKDPGYRKAEVDSLLSSLE